MKLDQSILNKGILDESFSNVSSDDIFSLKKQISDIENTISERENKLKERGVSITLARAIIAELESLKSQLSDLKSRLSNYINSAKPTLPISASVPVSTIIKDVDKIEGYPINTKNNTSTTLSESERLVENENEVFSIKNIVIATSIFVAVLSLVLTIKYLKK